MSSSPRVPSALQGTEEIEAWLVRWFVERLGVASKSIETHERFSRYGLDSLKAAEMLAELSEALGRPLSSTLIWRYPTISALTHYLIAGASFMPARPSVLSTRPLGGGRERTSADESIAVIGLACRFPKAPNPGAFWRLLRDGVDAITEVPADRWDVEALFDSDLSVPGKMSTRWGGFLEQVDQFEPEFFDISPREAIQMDPQQRLMLELSWEALRDAGMVPMALKGSRTGVFFGAMWSDYAKGPRGALDLIVQQTATGQDLSIIPARVSYTFGFSGPSIAINTACSSALVAVHLACQSLLRGESRLALAGGVNLILAPESMVAMSKFGAMAPDGRSKAFDARANGYVRGEGGGIVVLKRLSRAIADGDPIYCVIRGSAVNNDGFSNGLTAPNPKAQEAVLRDAYERAREKPAAVQYAEAHGTGTILGDPIEAKALAAVLCAHRSAEQPLRLGSVKTNIGHLESAAGIAGLIKVALSMRHRAIPQSLHFQQPNPHIPFTELHLQVQSTLEAWPSDEKGRMLAGVSSFGFGGTNCHVVLEGAYSSSARILPLSAGDPRALDALARGLRDHLRSLCEDTAARPNLAALCAMAATRLSEERHRLALVVDSCEAVEASLSSFLEGVKRVGMSSGQVGDHRPKAVFVFAGQGSQWIGMGRDLLREEPVFREAFLQCDEAISPHVNFSLLEVLTTDDEHALDKSSVAQPAIFAIQVALAALWRSFGVEPDAVVGQSMGEVAAAHVAGALSLEDAARIICRRSQLVERVSGKGKMAVVDLSLAEAERVISGYEARLSIAVSTTPGSTVLSGDSEALDVVLETLRASGIFCQVIKVDYASHSPQMEPLRSDLWLALERISPRTATIPFYSTVTGGPLIGTELDAAYWVRNLREPVLFSSAIERLLGDGYETFLDLNPHPIVTHAIGQCLSHFQKHGIALPSMRREDAARGVFLDSLSVLYTLGIPVRWDRLNPIEHESASAPLEQKLIQLLGAVAKNVSGAEDTAPSQLLVLSARSEASLEVMAQAMSSWVKERPDITLTDLCATASLRCSHHEHRLAVSGRSREEIAANLDGFLAGEASTSVAQGSVSSERSLKVVFVFPGQGSQWAGMGLSLLDQEPVFRTVMEACHEHLQQLAGWSLLDELRAPEGSSRLHETEVAQPALFALQVALAALWRSWGITPDAVLGHSVGEVAAAHIAGALSLEEAMRVVFHRGRLMQQATGLGQMATVNLPAEALSSALRAHAGRLAIAAINDPASTVLSGDAAALAEVLHRLRAEGVRCRELRVNYAFHSPQMDPIKRALSSVLGYIDLGPLTLPMYSSVTRGKVAGEDLSAAYWAKNIRETVQFAGAVGAAIGDGYQTFLEVGPHPVLSVNIESCLEAQKEQGQVLFSLRREQEERRSLLQSLGRLYAHGYPVKWEHVYTKAYRCVPLPPYPWQRRRYWLDAARAPQAYGGSMASRHPLLGAQLPVAGTGAVFTMSLGTKIVGYLGDHRVFSRLVVPGTGLLEMARAAGSARLGPEWSRVTGLLVQAPLMLPEQGERQVQVVIGEATAEGAPVTIYSQASPALPGEGWTVHAKGHVQPVAENETPAPVDRTAVRARCSVRASIEETYAMFEAAGLMCGPAFQGMTELWVGTNEAVSRVELPLAAGGDAGAYGVHPALLDAALRTLLAALGGLRSGLYLPFEITNFRVWQPGVAAAWVVARGASVPAPDAEVISGDVTMLGENGEVLAEVLGLRLKRARVASLGQAGGLATTAELYSLLWQEVPWVQASREPSTGSWLVLTDGSALGEAIVRYLRAAGVRCITVARGQSGERVAADRFVVDPRSTAAFGPVLAAAVEDALALQGVVCLWGAETKDDEAASPAEAAEWRLVAGLHMVQALARQGTASAPRLFWVTRGAQAASSGDEVAVAQAPLWGLFRVVMREHPDFRCTLVDLGPGPEDAAEALWKELWQADDEQQVVLRSGKRQAARLIKAPASAKVISPPPITADSTVLITGGVGALGLFVARWLVEEHGVRHLVLASRRAPEGDPRSSVEAIRALGAQVTVVQVDVANLGEVQRLLDALPAEPPLRGIVHAAGVLDDGVLTQQDAGRLMAVLSPKVRGAWNLHVATRGTPLSFFVMFSSSAALLGTAGQGNYAAANAFLDALAHARRAEGLPAHSLNWGPWAEGGMAAALLAAQRQLLARQGLGMLSTAEGLSLLGKALSRPEAVLAPLPLDLRALRQALGARAASPLWWALLDTRSAQSRERATGAWAARLRGLTPSARATAVESAVQADIAKVLGIDSASAVPTDRTLGDMGLDSLMAVELRNVLSARVGERLPATLVFDYPTVGALTRYLLDKVLPAASAAPSPVLPVALTATREEPIAIVGVGCRLPGGVSDPESFWRMLEQGVDGIREIPPERWDVDAYYDPDLDAPGKMVSRWGGFLEHVDRFEPNFFGISPREAVKSDPQQRLLLEVGWEALEQAGQTLEKLMGSDTGVYMGLWGTEYQTMAMAHAEAIDVYSLLGTEHSAVVARLSYWLGLKGPNLSVDTACSSSLVAVHLACQALRAGECSMALAGGVNLTLMPENSVYVSKMRAMSPTGRCHTFSDDADGYVRSEGCVVLVLKRLSDARRDGDPILALVRGTAVNQDGRTNGLTTPNGPSQETVIRRALKQAGVAPAAVGYVEAHGTGTPLGDPIEVQALGAVFSEGRAPDQPLVIGSVKTNIGHTEAASGAAGILKVVLALQHELIPRSLHFTAPNRHIPWTELNVSVAAKAVPWPAGGSPRIAGVSAFGFSGTNAHVVLEEAPFSAVKPALPARSAELVVLSARSASALNEQAARLSAHLSAHPELALGDVAFSLATTRSAMEHRLSVVATSLSALHEALDAAAAGQTPAEATRDKARNAGGKVAFLFTGQGAQVPGMGRGLAAAWPAFREAFERCVALFDRELERPLCEVMWAEPGSAEAALLDQTAYTQPALFTLEYALVALWRSWGITPAQVIGHSIGELCAACVAGVFSLEDATRLVAARGRLMQALSAGGAMVSIAANEAEVAEAVAPYAKAVSIAAVNGPEQVVIAGDEDAVKTIAAAFEARGVRTKPLQVSHAFHSPLIDPMLAAFEQVARSVTYQPPSLEFVSNLSGRLVTEEVTKPSYWVRHAREAVRFADGVKALHDAGAGIFVELGPRAALLSLLPLCLPDAELVLLPSLRAGREESTCVLSALGGAWGAGRAVAWEGVFAAGGRRVALPTYPWQRERYWLPQTPRVDRPLGVLGPHRAEEGPRDELAGCVFAVEWRRQEHLAEPEVGAATEQGAYLVLIDYGGTGEALAARLLARGEACVQVMTGEEYVCEKPGVYRIDPSNPADYRRLLSQAFGNGRACRGALHLWSLDATPTERTSLDSLDQDLVRGSVSALYLAQALLLQGWRDVPRLWLVTRGAQAAGEEQAKPVAIAQAPIWGFARTLSLEHPALRCTRVDLDPTPSGKDDAWLLRELRSHEREDQIALRNEGRYVARLVPSRFGPEGAPTQRIAAETQPLSIRPDASYLITGGLGGLGLDLARWLVEQGARHLALVGRRAPGESERAVIRGLEEAGARVLVMQVDISRRADVVALLSEIEQHLAPLRGVVHAAMVMDHRTVLDLQETHVRRVAAPKISGTFNLHELTKDKPLDFFVMYSSIVSVLGAMGEAHYSAASAFLDAMAQHRWRAGLPAMSIQWGVFAQIGGVTKLDARVAERLSIRGLDFLMPAQGTEALGRLLRSPRAEIVVARFNLRRWMEFYPTVALSPLFAEMQRESGSPVSLGTDEGSLRTALRAAKSDERLALLELHIAQQLGRVMQLEASRIDRHAPFSSLGADSLMSLELRNRLEVTLGVKLPTTLLFTYSHTASLAEHLMVLLGFSAPPSQARMRDEQGPRSRPAESTKSLESLGKKELLALLEQSYERVESEKIQ